MNWNRVSFVLFVLIVVISFTALITSVSQGHWFGDDDPRFQECDAETHDDTLSRREQWSVFRQCVWEFHPHGKNPPR